MLLSNDDIFEDSSSIQGLKLCLNTSPEQVLWSPKHRGRSRKFSYTDISCRDTKLEKTDLKTVTVAENFGANV